MAHDLVPSTAQVLPESQRGLRPARSTAAVLGAAAIVFVAVAALVALVARGDGPSDEALLVLPVGDWQLRDGGITAPIDDSDVPAADERFIVEGSLYGFADGDGFDNLRSFVLYRASPLPGSSWEPVETEAGGSFRRLDQPMTLARQESDGVWHVASTPSDLVNAYSTLIDDIPSGMVLVAVFDSLDAPPAPTASFVMTSPAGATFTVETTTGSPLFDAATFAERVDPVDIAGIAGWIVTPEDDDATETIVTWAPEPDRTITVRGDVSREAVLDAARRLRPVSADEWATAFSTPGPD